jgi:acetyl-CoA acyltransferase
MDAFICDYIRTPIGRFGGSLSSVRPDDLGAVPLKALMARHASLDWAQVDEVIYGCANQAGEDNRNVARMSSLLAGLPESVPGTTINRLCGSGMDAVIAAARAIKAGEIGLAIAGGVESMSRAPFVLPKADSAFSRNAEIHDTTIGWRFVNPLMKAQYGIDSMPETGENVAEDFTVTREAQDAFALRSQAKAAAAIKAGRFDAEITPVTIPNRKGDPTIVSRDEHPRETTMEALAKLGTPFRRGGSVTAGNASGVNDGAAALIIASEAAAKRHGLTPSTCHREALRAARPDALAVRCHRTQRGLCQPGHRDVATAWYPGGCGACEPQRRSHRAGSSPRHVRRAHHGYGSAGAEAAWRPLRPRHDVHRCRSGHRDCRRAGVIVTGSSHC